MLDTKYNNAAQIFVKLGQSVSRSIVSYIIIISLTFSPLAAYPSSGVVNKNQEYNAALSRLDDFMGLLSQLRTSIDRSQFDLDTLLEKLNFDADEIINFVTEEIHFEQYAGLLRGAQGTLMNRAGNALDQAVLLAALLNDAGYEARIKRADISDKLATTLVQQLTIEKPKLLPIENNASNKKLLGKMFGTVNLPAEKIEAVVETLFNQQDVSTSDVYHEAGTDVAFINSVLQANGKLLKDRDITDELLTEAKDYFWVEYRLGPSDPEISVHPALGPKIKGFDNLQVKETFKDQIPQNLQHRFRFQVFNEQKIGNKLTVTPLMTVWERPAANLIGKRLTFNNYPDGLKKLSALSDPGKVAKDTRFITPVFKVNDSSASELDLFDLSGTILDLDVLKMGGGAFAGLFQSLGDKMESALQATDTGGTEEEDNYRTLSAQWVEYTLISPDGEEKQIKRYTIDRISAANRLTGKLSIDKFQSREEAIWKLAESIEFLVSPGSYPEAYIFDRYLQRILAAREALEMAIHSTYFPGENTTYTASQISAFNDNPALWLMAAIDTNILSATGARNYQYQPSLLIVNSGIIYNEKEQRNRFTVDIANTGQRVISKVGKQLFNAPQAAVLSGAWATRLEEVNFRSGGSPSINQWNTRKAFQLAKDKQIPVKLLVPDNQQELAGLKELSAETRLAIEQDLQQGYMVIVPERPVTVDAQAGWWRVHPDTGETLGMISGGLGGDVYEYVIKTTLIAASLSAVLAAGGLIGCLSSNKCSPSGCFKSAGIGFLLGFAIGTAIGLLLVAVIPETVAIGGGAVVAGGNIADVLAFSGGIVLDSLDAGGMGPVSQIVPSCLD